MYRSYRRSEDDLGRGAISTAYGTVENGSTGDYSAAQLAGGSIGLRVVFGPGGWLRTAAELLSLICNKVRRLSFSSCTRRSTLRWSMGSSGRPGRHKSAEIALGVPRS